MTSIVIDNLLLAALVKSIGNIITAAVPSIVTYFISKKVVNELALKKKLSTAYKDIQFLLQVESFHCRANKENTGQSYKVTIRNSVKNETDLEFSGKHTFSSVSRKLSEV